MSVFEENSNVVVEKIIKSNLSNFSRNTILYLENKDIYIVDAFNSLLLNVKNLFMNNVDISDLIKKSTLASSYRCENFYMNRYLKYLNIRKYIFVDSCDNTCLLGNKMRDPNILNDEGKIEQINFNSYMDELQNRYDSAFNIRFENNKLSNINCSFDLELKKKLSLNRPVYLISNLIRILMKTDDYILKNHISKITGIFYINDDNNEILKKEFVFRIIEMTILDNLR